MNEFVEGDVVVIRNLETGSRGDYWFWGGVWWKDNGVDFTPTGYTKAIMRGLMDAARAFGLDVKMNGGDHE